MTTEDLIEKAKNGEVWFWSTGFVEDGDNAFTLICPIIIQPGDMKRYQCAMDAALKLPVPMVLYCPRCWMLHIDQEESEEDYQERIQYCLKGEEPERWMNPPHKEHLCQQCHHKWKPALIPTIGVEEL